MRTNIYITSRCFSSIFGDENDSLEDPACDIKCRLQEQRCCGTRAILFDDRSILLNIKKLTIVGDTAPLENWFKTAQRVMHTCTIASMVSACCDCNNSVRYILSKRVKLQRCL